MNMEILGSARTNRPAATLSITVAPDPRSGKSVRTQVTAFAETHQVADDDLREFLTALGEALANAIEHAASSDQIEVTCRIENDGVMVGEVLDYGIGFAPPAVIGPLLPDVLAERGRGLGIMRRCTDNICVKSAPGEGTRVTFSRFLRGRPTTG
jgi:serine/threonine-protein kinase RsbW